MKWSEESVLQPDMKIDENKEVINVEFVKPNNINILYNNTESFEISDTTTLELEDNV